MKRLALALSLALLYPVGASAQTSELHAYFDSPEIRKAVADVVAMPAGTRKADLSDLLPDKRSASFVNYLMMTRGTAAWGAVEALRLNKMIQAPAAAGGTSLVSSVIAPAVLGAAIEYGSVLQESTGTTTTLRANLLGVGRLVLGDAQFPYCPEIDVARCARGSRWLRSFSGAVSFQQRPASASGSTSTATTGAATAPSVQDVLGSQYRVSSWGVRWDFTSSGHLDDPKYLEAWTGAIASLRKHPAADGLSTAIVAFFGANLDVYGDWRSKTVVLLNDAPDADRFYRVFEEQLRTLVDEMFTADPAMGTKLLALHRAYAGYFTARDALIRQAQVHKASLEFTTYDPAGQPRTSNVRFIYSHQPTTAPVVITINTAVSVYNSTPVGQSTGRLRDVQAAAQVDRRLDSTLGTGPLVLTLAGYYQWMRDDAVVDVATTAAGSVSGLTLPSGAATVLGTKGHIVVLQGKLAVPLNNVVKVPFSVTWSNRRELVKEQTVRGQVGLSIDLDGVFR